MCAQVLKPRCISMDTSISSASKTICTVSVNRIKQSLQHIFKQVEHSFTLTPIPQIGSCYEGQMTGRRENSGWIPMSRRRVGHMFSLANIYNIIL